MKMFSEAKCSCGKHQHRHLPKRWKKKLSSRKQVSKGEMSLLTDQFFLLQMKLPTRLCKIFINSEVIYLPQAIKLTIRIDNDE